MQRRAVPGRLMPCSNLDQGTGGDVTLPHLSRGRVPKRPEPPVTAGNERRTGFDRSRTEKLSLAVRDSCPSSFKAWDRSRMEKAVGRSPTRVRTCSAEGLQRSGFSGGSFHWAMQPYRGSRGLHSNCPRPQRAGCAR
jgi:hypothetical protein